MIEQTIKVLASVSILFLLWNILLSWGIYCGNQYYMNRRTDYDDGFYLLMVFSFIGFLFLSIPTVVVSIQILFHCSILYKVLVLGNYILGLFLSLRLQKNYLSKFKMIKNTDLRSWIWLVYWMLIISTNIFPLFVIIIHIFLNVLKVATFNKNYNDFMNSKE